MNYKLYLSKNPDGTYDLVVDYKNVTEEFAAEFLQEDRIKTNVNILDFIKRNAKKVSIAGIKVIVAGVVIASITGAGLMSVAAASERYSMSYLYGGTSAQQMQYVKNTNSSLNTVSPSYYDITATGQLKQNTIDKEFVNSMHLLNLKVVPFLSNHWDRQAGIAFLQDTDRWSSQIANSVAANNLDGINVDIENVTHEQRDAYTRFVSELRAKIPKDKEVSVAVAANPNGWAQGWHGSYNYSALAQNSDYLMIMAYDEHYQGGDAGPVASIGFVENSIKYALKYAPANKIVVGIPFFGRIWSSDGNFNGNGINLNQIEPLLKTYKGKITYEAASKSPKLEFTVKAGDVQSSVGGKTLKPGNYVIWYENEESIREKLALVQKYDLKGAGSWALGKEPVSVWENYGGWLNGTPAATTTPVAPATPAPKPPVVSKTGVVTASTLNVRKSASSTASVITKVKKGDKLTIQQTLSTGWYKVKLSNGKVGYVSKQYVKIASTAAKSTATSKTTTSNVNVRAAASTSSKKLGTLSKGTKVTVLSKSGTFSKILYKGSAAYVASQYLK